MNDCQQQYFGKYRGTVIHNVDPRQLGRVQVSVPAVLGDGRLSWAMPSVPYAGPGVGFFAVPPKDANVWVEFEAGDLERPIWSGCFWGPGETPAQPAIPGTKVLATESIRLELNDVPGNGGFTLKVTPPAVSAALKLVLDGQGIVLETAAGSLKLTPSALELNQEPARIQLSPSAIQLENGAAKVELSAAAVTINEGALEVI